MRRLRPFFFTLALATCLAAEACEPQDSYYLVISTANGEGASLQSYKPGDTVSFAAVEWVQHPFSGAETTRSSAVQPDAFTWSTADSAVATVVTSGRVFMKSTGSTNVLVKTSRASISAPIHIAP